MGVSPPPRMCLLSPCCATTVAPVFFWNCTSGYLCCVIERSIRCFMHIGWLSEIIYGARVSLSTMLTICRSSRMLALEWITMKSRSTLHERA